MFADLPLAALLTVLAAAGAAILLSGLRMTRLADQLADRTRLGEALIGGVLLGASTSMSGTIVSLTSALDGRASLAFSNGIGGIAAQTAFLAVADLVHRRANLEHAAAELVNLFQAALLMLLLTIPLVAWMTPEAAIMAVHPASLALVVVYGIGLFASKRVREKPMWRPVTTETTHADEPEEDDGDARSTLRLFLVFAGLMVVMGIAGWGVARSASVLTDRYGLSASLVGALLTAVLTSLPELVTTLAAVRQGSLQLAVGGIIGGNTFDVLFLTLSDLGYREGSLYAAVGSADYFWLVTGLVMTAILTLGLIYRQQKGPAGIGWESLMILLVYVGAIATQALGA